MNLSNQQRWTPFGWLVALSIIAGLCIGVYVYNHSRDSFISDKTADAETMWSLTSSFVSTYSGIRGSHTTEATPVPAEFRAQAISSFNTKHENSDEYWSALMVGVPGKEIVTLPPDSIVSDRLLAMSTSGKFEKYDKVVEIAGEPTLRSIFPSIATKQSCVDCHNSIQAGAHDWKTGELMGAFVLDRKIAVALSSIRRLGWIAGLMSAFLVLVVGIPLIRMRAEQQAAAELLVGALDAIDDPFIVYDHDDNLILFNRAFSSSTDLNAGQLKKGMKFQDVQKILHGNDDAATSASKLHQRRVQMREWANSDEAIIVADDSGSWYRHTVRELSSGHMIELQSDITELKQRENELKRSRSRLQQSEMQARRLALIAEHANDAMVITDTDGRTIWINEAFTTLTGFEFSEVLNEKPGTLLQGEDTDQQDVNRISAAVRRGERVRCEILNYAKDKTPYWVEIDISPVYSDAGELQNFVAVERNTTEKKQIEVNLEESRVRAEAASRAKSIFLANMSHEIRTPMNGVIATTELLLDTDLDVEQRQYAKTVFQSGNSLLTIINDVLDFSKIEAGRMELDPVGFDLRAALQDVVNLVKTNADEKDLTMTFAYSDQIPDRFTGDVGRIRQIVTNLIGNAIKFTLKGSVTVTVDGKRSGNYDGDNSDPCYDLCIAIEDTGIGIPEGQINKIFAQFEQVNGETNRQFEGTGLGLSISRRLVELMQGALEVESTLGQGSTFRISLSLPQDQHGSDVTTGSEADEINHRNRAILSNPDDLADPGPAIHMLVAEDNKTNQFVIRKMLNNIGNFAVEIAEDGRQAVDMFVQHRPDIILMDISMPVMNGLEATAAIRAYELANGLARCPIVALTANAMQGDREKCVQGGMDDYLTKPVSRDSLRKMLKSWIAKGNQDADAA